MKINTNAIPVKVVSLSSNALNELHKQLTDLEDEEVDVVKSTVNIVIDTLLDARLDKELSVENSYVRPIVNLVGHRHTLSKVSRRPIIMQVRNAVLSEIESMQAAQQGGARRSRRKSRRKSRRTSRR